MVTKEHHVPLAQLQAFAAGELDAVERGAIEGHLSACEECRAQEQRVDRMRSLFAQMPPADLDDLAWRRIGNNVKAQLERDAIARHRALAREPAELLPWVALGAVTAAAITIAILISSDAPNEARPELAPAQLAEKEVAPQPGVYLHLQQGTDVHARSAKTNELALDLNSGTLDVRAFAPIDPQTSITVHGSDFQAIARSNDFSIGYRGSEAFIEVRDGEVDVHELGARTNRGAAKGPKTTVKRGERKIVAQKVTAAKPERAVQIAEKREEPAGEPVARDEEKPAGDPKVSEEPAPAAQPSIRIVSEGEVDVSSEALPDEIARLWADVNEAYYTKRDIARAIRLAEQLVATGRPRPEVFQAQDFLCSLYAESKQPEKAIEACLVMAQKLEASHNDERARGIHARIATIFRNDLKDCAKAMKHYSAAMVFGRGSPFDDDALMGHAYCAIELGDEDNARRDLIMLERSGTALARPRELVDLKLRFEAMKSGSPPGSVPRASERDR